MSGAALTTPDSAGPAGSGSLRSRLLGANPSLVAGLVVVGAVLAFWLLGSILVDRADTVVGAAPQSLAPSGEHLLGTDAQGREVLAVLVVATPATLQIGLIAGVVGVAAGLLLGLLAGYLGGVVDAVVRLLSDALMTVPGIAILLVIATNVDRMSVQLMGITVAALAWMHPTRAIRAQVLSIRERDYLRIARANGERGYEVIFREVMPNLLPYAAATFVGAVGAAMLAAVGLEALGLGANDQHTLGTMIYWAREFGAVVLGQWWWYLPPIAMIAVAVVGLFYLSVGLDRVANPQLAVASGRPAALASDPADMDPDPGGMDPDPEAPAGAAALRVAGLRVAYDTARGPVWAVDGVSFALRPGERMGLIGESGSGKTTMATAVTRLTRPPGRVAAGRVWVLGTDLTSLPGRELRAMRGRDLAYIPQAAMNSLNPVMRIGDQVADALLAGEKVPRRKLPERVAAALARVELPPALAARFPHQLSGGQRQRVAMAIATVRNPSVIVADEPTSALDVIVQRQVMTTLSAVQAGLGAAVVLVGHDMGLMAQFVETLAVLYAGRIVEYGPVEELLTRPRHPYTRLLIDSLPVLDERRELRGIPGIPPSPGQRRTGCAFAPRCPYALARCATEPPPVHRTAGRRVACHLYPAHAELPELAPPADRFRHPEPALPEVG